MPFFALFPFLRHLPLLDPTLVFSTAVSSLSERSAPYLRRRSEDYRCKCPVGAAVDGDFNRPAPRCLSNLSHDTDLPSVLPSMLTLSRARLTSLKNPTPQVANARPIVTSVSFIRDIEDRDVGERTRNMIKPSRGERRREKQRKPLSRRPRQEKPLPPFSFFLSLLPRLLAWRREQQQQAPERLHLSIAAEGLVPCQQRRS